MNGYKNLTYKLCTVNNPDGIFKTNKLEFLIKKVEFFNSFRVGVKAKVKVICCKTGRVVYD